MSLLQRILMRRVALAAAIAVGALASPAPAAAHEPRWADVAPALEKIREGDSVRDASASISLSAARGECEATQLVTRGPQRDVVATATDLAQDGADTIAPRLYREAFIHVTEASNAEGRTGWWTDALIPAKDDYAGEDRNAFPATSQRGEPVVAYYEVCVPLSAKPGLYRGEVSLRARGREALAFPVRLRVRGFSLPATSTLPNSFGFSSRTAARAHGVPTDGPEMRALARLYALAALKHRISFYGMSFDPPPILPGAGSMKVDFSAWDAEVGPFLDGSALPNGARFTSTDLRLNPAASTDARKIEYWRAWAQHLRAKGWLDRAFVYAKDEPTPADLAEVRHAAELVHRADPGLRVLVTATLEPGIDGAADIFTPNINCLFARPGAAYCRTQLAVAGYARALARGKQLWWYQSCGSHGCGPISPVDVAAQAYFTGWPSYMVDHPAPLNRAMGVLAYRYAIQGELYFDTLNAWSPGPHGEKAEPWDSLWRFHGNGDGTLFYPGTVDRIGGRTPIPIESLRLKAIRDGLEDYEYLVLARRLGLRRQADALARQLAPRPFEISRDPSQWARAREGLANQIEATMRKRGEFPIRPAVQGPP